MRDDRQLPLEARPVRCVGGDRDGEIFHVAKASSSVAFAVYQRGGTFKEVVRPIHETRMGPDEVYTHAIPSRWHDV